jgi:hypothetical protein
MLMITLPSECDVSVDHGGTWCSTPCWWSCFPLNVASRWIMVVLGVVLHVDDHASLWMWRLGGSWWYLVWYSMLMIMLPSECGVSVDHGGTWCVTPCWWSRFPLNHRRLYRSGSFLLSIYSKYEPERYNRLCSECGVSVDHGDTWCGTPCWWSCFPVNVASRWINPQLTKNWNE